MKNLVLMISVVLCAAACDSQSTSTPQAKTTPVIDVPTEKETKEEIKENVKDVLKERPPKWKVEYTGDYKGEIHGGIMSVVSVSTTTSVDPVVSHDDFQPQ